MWSRKSVPMRDHFVVIGAQRCGTTYLYRLLDEHPEIEMAKPLRPEPKFFLDDRLYAKGLDFYETEYFSDPAARLLGEKSTSYLESEIAAARLAKTLPSSPLVVVLRDPVQRAISNYRFTAQHGHEELPLAEALRASQTRGRRWDRERFSVSPYAYVPRGRYVDFLERYARHVPREHLSVVLFEELTQDPAVIAGLYERLGVDPSFRPAGFGAVVNASDENDEPVEPELEAWLREQFREPNRRLASFLGRELPWG